MKIPRDDHVADYVDAYLHGALDEDDAQYVRDRCETCSISAAALAEAEKRFAMFQTVAPSEAAESLIQGTLQHVDDRVERRKQGWRVYRNLVMVALAASVLLVGGMHLHYDRLQPTPYDLRILGQARWLAGSSSTLRLAVFDQRTGRPLSNVPAKLSLIDRNSNDMIELCSFQTDEQGEEMPRFEVPELPDGQYDLLFSAQLDGQWETLQRSVRIRRTWKLMLSSDKPIYQPGQTIHLRSMSLRQPDLKPLQDQQAVFEITDPKGNVIFKRETVTSKFGIASADCALANELNLGQYTIKCRIHDTTATRTVDVQRYVLPKFKVSLSADRPYYTPSQQANIVVDANYFFGKPVADAKVDLEVYGDAAGLFEIAKLSKQADQEGKATFSFNLPDYFAGRPKNQGSAKIQFFAKVTDSTGLEYSKQLSRLVTANPIHIEVIPENGRLTPGVANRVYLYSSYVDGRPAKTKVVVDGIADDLETSALGVTSFEVTPDSDTVKMTVRASDASGATGHRTVSLSRGGSETFVLRTNKAVFDGGDTIVFQCLGAGVEPIFLDLVKEDQSLVTVMVEMKDGVGQTELELPPEVFGPISVVAHRFDHQGLAINKSRAIFVRQPNSLTISATMDEKEYRPGETAQVTFSVKDKSGKPVPSALTLAIVDEAVFSVMDQAAGMEKVFFLLENELLKPVYAIYNWAPEWGGEIASEERIAFEQALFARTATESADNYSLTAVSFPAKQAKVSEVRSDGLGRAKRGWVTLAIVWTLVGIGTFAVWQPKWFLILSGTLVLLGGVLFAALLVVSFTVMEARSTGEALDMMANEAEMFLEGAAMEAPEMAMPMDPTSAPMGGGSDVSLPTIRKRFPETLLWNPELITDEQGNASLEVPLADSITTWRITASSVSAEGQLGAEQFPMKVFQPFFVDINSPYALTRNDEAAIPVAVYNYLDETQEVEVTLKKEEWFDWLDADDTARQVVTLKPGEVRGLSFPIQVTRAGKHTLTVTAIAGQSSDAVQRPITILPGGERVELVQSGSLAPAYVGDLEYPEAAIENSLTAYVKIYPSAFSELVEGLDNIFRMPGGCFEQTSSTTYPNILALDYLRSTKKSVPELEAKARQYIHVGYQRLVSFEVSGGGFEWFGNPPANITLTAYGLMEFEDMAKVHDVDPKLIERTRNWLLAKREADGSWKPISQGIDDGLLSSVHRGPNANLAMTAYVAWAVFYQGNLSEQAGVTLDYLLSHAPSSIDDPYLLATMANAIANIDPDHPDLGPYYDRLVELKQSSEDGKKSWWDQSPDDSTLFYGRGRGGAVETTALAAQALMRSKKYPAVVSSSLAWIAEQKDANGTWHSTQATVLALKALIMGTSAPITEEDRAFEVLVDGNVVKELTIPANQSEVVQHVSLSRIIEPGAHQVSVRDLKESGANFQLVFAYHIPSAETPDEQTDESLQIEINYDRERLSVSDYVTAEAVVVNQLDSVAPMVILDLPIPGGFALERGELDELVGSRTIEKYQMTPRKAIVYLRGLEPGKPLKLRYRLRATMPVKVQVPPAEAYQYYDPDQRGKSRVVTLEAQAA